MGPLKPAYTTAPFPILVHPRNGRSARRSTLQNRASQQQQTDIPQAPSSEPASIPTAAALGRSPTSQRARPAPAGRSPRGKQRVHAELRPSRPRYASSVPLSDTHVSRAVQPTARLHRLADGNTAFTGSTIGLSVPSSVGATSRGGRDERNDLTRRWTERLDRLVTQQVVVSHLLPPSRRSSDPPTPAQGTPAPPPRASDIPRPSSVLC